MENYTLTPEELTQKQDMEIAEAEMAIETGASDRRMEAIRLHEGIKADVRIVAQGLSDIGKKLKQMRDDKLYAELGHKSFADYGKAMLGLEQRQLYSYIQIFETYGPRFIDEHSEFGISKLLLLANVPATDREEFVAENDVESLTVRELREITEKYNKAAEQLTLLSEEKEDRAVELEILSEENASLSERAKREKTEAAELKRSLELERAHYRETEDTLRRQLKEMENKPIDIAVQEPDEAVLAQIRAEAESTAQKAMQGEIEKIKAQAEKAEAQAALDIAKAEDSAAAKIAQAQAEASKAAAEQLKANLTGIEHEKGEAIERAAELEKKLALAANPDTVYINFLFEEIQELVAKARTRIETMREPEPEKAAKFTAATAKVLKILAAGFEGEHQ